MPWLLMGISCRARWHLIPWTAAALHQPTLPLGASLASGQDAASLAGLAESRLQQLMLFMAPGQLSFLPGKTRNTVCVTHQAIFHLLTGLPCCSLLQPEIAVILECMLLLARLHLSVPKLLMRRQLTFQSLLLDRWLQMQPARASWIRLARVCATPGGWGQQVLCTGELQGCRAKCSLQSPHRWLYLESVRPALLWWHGAAFLIALQ